MQQTSFEEKVYAYVKRIPFGKVSTYQRVAEACGSPAASRAVGNALRKNPCSFLRKDLALDEKIPCHRVVRANQRIGGFAGSDHLMIIKKIRLLGNEGIMILHDRIQHFDEVLYIRG